MKRFMREIKVEKGRYDAALSAYAEDKKVLDQIAKLYYLTTDDALSKLEVKQHVYDMRLPSGKSLENLLWDFSCYFGTYYIDHLGENKHHVSFKSDLIAMTFKHCPVSGSVDGQISYRRRVQN